jgi:2-keto-4-pentenoate hydratase
MNATASSEIESAASVLCRSRLNRERFNGFPSGWKPTDEAQAYSVQKSLHSQLTRHSWGRLMGHKIGCTTPVMQAYLGIDNPCAGGIFDTTVQQQVGHFRIPHDLRVGVECEIAVLLGRDLRREDAPFERGSLADAVEGCLAAIEVVEDRYVDYRALDTPTLIADDFFGAGCVLGSIGKGFSPLELSTVSAKMWINRIEVGSGAGTDVLGDPLNALSWLANSLAERGQELHRGEFILLGSLVQTNWVERGDKVIIRNDPLGEVRVTFT